MRLLMRFFVIFFALGYISTAKAQEKKPLPLKLKRAFYQLSVGQKLQKKNLLDSANTFYNKAFPIFERYKRYTQQLQCLTLLTENKFVTNKAADAIVYADSLLNVIEKKKLAGRRSAYKNIALQRSAEVLYVKAKIAYQTRDFENGVRFIQQTISNYKNLKNKDWKRMSRSYLEMSKFYTELGYYDFAIASLDTTFNLFSKYEPQNKKAIFETYQLFAENYQQVADDAHTLPYINKALTAYEQVASKEDSLFLTNYPKAWASYMRGLVHDNQGNYDSALHYHRLALSEYIAQPKTLPKFTALSYLHIGISYEKKGLYYRALEFEQTALRTLADSSLRFHLTEAEIFDHLGAVYARMGDVDQAIYYQENTMRIREEELSAYHPDKARVALHLGNTYFQRKIYDKAEKYYLQALYICEESLKPSHPLFADIYNSIGVLAQVQNRGDFASSQFKKALDIYEKTLHQTQHPAIAKIYDNLSSLFEQEKKYIDAMEYSLKSLGIYETVLGLKHPALSEGYYHLGIISEQLHKYEQALIYYQKAVNAIVPDFETNDLYALPPIKNVLADNLLLEILTNRAALTQKRAENDTKMLTNALQTYSLCAELIDKMRNGYKAEGSKFFLAQRTIPLYEDGIDLSIRLYEITKDKKYYAEAFAFSEKSKAGVLRSAIADTKAKRIAGIPDSLIAYEGQIRNELYELDKALFREQSRKELADVEKVLKLRNQVFEQKGKYDKLIDFLENAYPEYYMLKYESHKVDIQEVISKVLKNKKEKSTLIEYFVGNENIYIFTASETNYNITKLPKTPDFEGNLRGFRASIIYKLPEKMYDYSILLYDQLIKPIETQIVDKNILIIPDATLGNIPFEALISSTGKEKVVEDIKKEAYYKIPYLIKKFKINYAYSCILLLENKQDGKTAEHDYLGFAPFPEHNMSVMDTTTQLHLDMPRDIISQGRYVSALPATKTEIINIAQLFTKKNKKAITYISRDAQKDIVTSDELQQYKYLHFATHGFVSIEDPTFSGLLLSPNLTTKQDGILYANDIFSLQLNADLVVLSACETGLGKVIKGEGIIGLSRSFFYAGAKNILVSLWKVADQSTSDLMVDFYKKMLKDKYLNKAKALRNAKLEMIKEKTYALPYYWASFVLIGNKL